MAYPTHGEYLQSLYGTKWCVSARLTTRLRDKGYTVALSQKKYTAIRDEWARNHPAFLLAASLPEHPEKAFVLAAVLRALS